MARKGRDISGWIILDKPLELGSTPAVSRVRRAFDARKAGHAGTLDPAASGVLPIALGEATKTIHFLTNATKVYEALVVFGAATTTDDAVGTVLRESVVRPSDQEIARAVPHFMGAIEQMPPQYSALKIAGRRAYDLARQGETAALEPRWVQIDAIEILERPDADHLRLRVTCGKGTYIRSLARDLAQYLGTEGHLAALRRTRVGNFSIQDAIGLEKLMDLGHSAADLAAMDRLLMPLEAPLDDIPAFLVDLEQTNQLRHGQPVQAALDDCQMVWAQHDRKAVALGHIEQGVFHPRRIFNHVLRDH
jgi:tRNA pseudouridine55 synthase